MRWNQSIWWPVIGQLIRPDPLEEVLVGQMQVEPEETSLWRNGLTLPTDYKINFQEVAADFHILKWLLVDFHSQHVSVISFLSGCPSLPPRWKSRAVKLPRKHQSYLHFWLSPPSHHHPSPSGLSGVLTPAAPTLSFRVPSLMQKSLRPLGGGGRGWCRFSLLWERTCFSAAALMHYLFRNLILEVSLCYSGDSCTQRLALLGDGLADRFLFIFKGHVRKIISCTSQHLVINKLQIVL